VDVEIEVAGLGSRFLAVFIDTLLQVLLALAVVAIGLVIGLQVPNVPIPFLQLVGINLVVVVYALGALLIYWGYYVIFEVARNGQTPGKSTLDLRVVREGGRPVTFFASAVRNVLRPLETVTPLAALTIVLVALGRKHKRIGDWAAGTIVIRERAKVVPVSAGPPPADGGSIPGLAPMTKIELGALGDGEISLIANLLGRRAELEPAARYRLTLEMARRAAEKMGRQLPDFLPATCEGFLEEIVRASR